MKKQTLLLLLGFCLPAVAADKPKVYTDQKVYLQAYIACVSALQGGKIENMDDDFIYACRNTAQSVATIGPDITGQLFNVTDDNRSQLQENKN
ncbi:hypothetical protein pEaSNUABM11_00152 [Erwinia phage pEa_SNUABM_11]|nr:hypothetical protein pEaSNUABM11_00152 [Erwinia phage pEa_SNUABM_11]